MQKTIATVLAAMLFGTAVGSPVKSVVGVRAEAEEEDRPPQNLWVWPTEALGYADVGVKYPTTVWIPEIGVWYKKVAENGYFFMGKNDGAGEFGDDYVTCKYYKSGYGWGVFLDLEPGHYVLGCEVDGDATFRLGFYKAVEGGYVWDSSVKLTSKWGVGWYERVFTVPEEASLTLLLPVSATTDAFLTTTGIEIYRLD